MFQHSIIQGTRDSLCTANFSNIEMTRARSGASLSRPTREGIALKIESRNSTSIYISDNIYDQLLQLTVCSQTSKGRSRSRPNTLTIPLDHHNKGWNSSRYRATKPSYTAGLANSHRKSFNSPCPASSNKSRAMIRRVFSCALFTYPTGPRTS